MTLAESVVTWFVVFVVPINAALNPILYTFSTSRFLSGGNAKHGPNNVQPSAIKYRAENRRDVPEGT